MSWSKTTSGRPIEGQAAPDGRPADGHDDAPSTIVPGDVKSGAKDQLSETLPAEPSTAGPSASAPTRTSEPARQDLHRRPEPADSASPGRARERYQILSEHGRGGLGRVFRAHDRELDRDVAVKELISRGPVSEVRFMREALITARLEHPGIVPVHEAGRWPDGTPYYAMKLVAGRPLRDLIAERTTVDERIRLLHHVIAVADALAYAHQRNIIHRDLKPSNVIVGDFGETIVIDWGLAKDLSTTEEPTINSGPFRANRDDDLTSAGTVLGTPAYMAPEQERGDPVDQRADVFAIGAMLWELCALQKVPPTDPRVRHRMLRRAGIDKDLATIIDKALEPDPKRRYPDAGALAADLKAFKSGARITARSYSLLGVLAHWTRRHRGAAFTFAFLSVLAFAGIALYIRDIATERERADSALARVEAAQAELILRHAETLMHTDPTAALSVLTGYHGSDRMRYSELRAEAHGRGVASSTTHPHYDTIWFLAGQPDGSFVSIGEDHRIQRTHAETITTLASNVSHTIRYSYSRTRNLLAYSTSPSGTAVLNLANGQITALGAEAPRDVVFSVDGSRLAVLDTNGWLSIWNTSARPRTTFRTKLPDSSTIAPQDNSTLIAFEHSTLSSIDLERGKTRSSVLPHPVTTVHATSRYIVAGLDEGTLAILSSTLTPIAAVSACPRSVRIVKAIPERDLIAFGCAGGAVGVARYSEAQRTITVTAELTTPTNIRSLAVFDDHKQILLIGERTAYIHDIDTKMTTRMDGQSALISAIATPSPGFPHVLLGDVTGTVRLWDLHPPNARVLATTPGTPFGARFSPDGTFLAIYGSDGVIRLIRMIDRSITDLRGHDGMIGGVRFSPDSRRLVSFSWDGTARTWQADGTLLRTFDDHHSIVQDSHLIDRGKQAVSIGDDGRLFTWDAIAGSKRLLLEHNSPLFAIQTMSTADAIIVRDTSGSIWTVTSKGNAKRIRTAGPSDVTIMRISPDESLLAIGQANGVVEVYKTSDWSLQYSNKFMGSIAKLEFDPKHRDLLIMPEAGHVALTSLTRTYHTPWNELRVEARDIAYSPRGDIISISTRDGGSWFYSRTRALWSYKQDHHTELLSGQFSPDDKYFVSINRSGTAIIRDSSEIFP